MSEQMQRKKIKAIAIAVLYSGTIAATIVFFDNKNFNAGMNLLSIALFLLSVMFLVVFVFIWSAFRIAAAHSLITLFYNYILLPTLIGLGMITSMFVFVDLCRSVF